MSHWLRACCLLGLLLGASQAVADKLRLVADAWPPFTDAAMAKGGVATELVSTALARAGYTTEFDQVPWARALLGIDEGHYDILVDAWYSDERTRIGQFSEGYLVNRISFLKRKDAAIDFTGDYDALHTYPIAVVRGYAYSQGFDSDAKMQKVPVHSFSMALRMLAAGRVQLALDDEVVARYYLSLEPAKVRNALEFLPKPLIENQLRILVSLQNPNHEHIVQSFNEQIAAMKADGTYDRLLKQYGM